MKSAIALLISATSVQAAAWTGEYVTKTDAGVLTEANLQSFAVNPFACLSNGGRFVQNRLTAVYDVNLWMYGTTALTSGASAAAFDLGTDAYACCADNAIGNTQCTTTVVNAGSDYVESVGTAGAAGTFVYWDLATAGTGSVDIIPEFALAATTQRAPASPRVAATDYCAAQVTTLTATEATLMTGGDAFTGLTKCTYFLVAANDGTTDATEYAPAFQLTKSETTAAGLDFWAYKLVVTEYELSDIASGNNGAPYIIPTGVTAVPITNTATPGARVDYTDIGA
jgi:hypothetical protein